MSSLRIDRTTFLSLIAALVISGCGGGGGSDQQTSNSSGSAGGNSVVVPNASGSTTITASEAGAPTATGDTATDGYNWTNYRRQQLGLSVLTRNNVIDTAAFGHSRYQSLNNIISHDQITGRPGFTGVSLRNRLDAAGYRFNQGSYAFGEVISASTNPSGFEAAEGLIAAIYHRFVMFEPRFREAGAGAEGSGGATYRYFTLNVAANGLGAGLGRGAFVTYPAANQQNIATVFYSDQESPDPVAERNEVGYPISVHADITSTVAVQSFTLSARGGASLPVKVLSRASDTNTPSSAAAIVPLSPLTAGTTYDVRFIGTIDGQSVNRDWSFTTR